MGLANLQVRLKCASIRPSRRFRTSIGMPTTATCRSRSIHLSNPSWFQSSPIARMRMGCASAVTCRPLCRRGNSFEGGADEIQHLNFIELNFLFPEVKETRNRDRFIKVAEHAREFTPDKPEVREFIIFLKQHHTVLDPTVSIFEGLFCGDPAVVTPGLEDIVSRLPPQIPRAMLR